MADKLQLEQQQIDDFRNICGLGASLLQAVIQRLNTADPLPLRHRELVGVLKDVLPSQSDAAESLARQAVFFNGTMRQVDLTPDEFDAGLRATVAGQAKWTDDELQKWSDVVPQFREIVRSHSVRLVTNAIDLSYEYVYLYRRGRVLTDIRPLFSENADSIEAAVVVHTLALRYEGMDGSHELSLCLDDADVHALIEQCQRALHKAATARELMNLRAGIPTIVTGEQNDE